MICLIILIKILIKNQKNENKIQKEKQIKNNTSKQIFKHIIYDELLNKTKK